jgi:hypothetical protein
MIWELAWALAVGAAAASAPSSITEMPRFMTGCWEQQTAKGFDEECWTDGRAGLMMGTGRYVADGAIEHWEWMRIVRGADGRLKFNASPTGDPMVTFDAIEQTGGSITFAKDDYAYFQHIRYTRTESGMDVELLFKDGKLLARRSYRSILRKGQ